MVQMVSGLALIPAFAALVGGARVQQQANLFNCQDYCLKCNDGSSVWIHRWKSPTKLIMAPIGIPLKVFTATEDLAPNIGLTCQKMSLVKFDRAHDMKAQDANEFCARVEMAKAAWGWQQQESNVLSEHASQYYGNANSTRDVKRFSQFMHDKTAYDLGCAMLIDENARSVLGKGDYLDDEYYRTGEAAYLCASHSALCGAQGVAGFVDAASSEACQAVCQADLKNTVEKFAPAWTEAVWGLMKARYMTTKQVETTVSLVENYPFRLQAYFEVGATAPYTSTDLQKVGALPGSLLTKIDSTYVMGLDFKEISRILEAKRDDAASGKARKDTVKLTFAPPRGCGERIMDEVLANPGYAIAKDKDNLHFYVACADKMEDSRKISCDPRECGGDSWCFVKAHCGNVFNKCKKDAGISLTCPEPPVTPPPTEEQAQCPFAALDDPDTPNGEMPMCSANQCCPRSAEFAGKTSPCPLAPNYQGCEHKPTLPEDAN